MNRKKNAMDFAMRWLGAAWHWLRNSPNAGSMALLAALGGVFLCSMYGYHEPFMPAVPDPNDLPKGWTPPPEGAYLTVFFLSYMRLFVLLGGVVYHIYILRAYPDMQKMIRPTWVACGFLALWTLVSQIYSLWEAHRLNFSGEAISTSAFIVQLLLVLALLASPPLALGYYAKAKILERYVMRSFLQPLVFCFIAFMTLWIVMDLLNNMADFQQNNIPKALIAMFYVKMIPFIYVTVAPITLLLATVYVLGRMSRTNELISMLGAGKSMSQVLRPIYITGAYAAILGTAANYHWAPVSAGNKQRLLEDVKERVAKNILVTGLVYRNPEARRTWFVGVVPDDMLRDKLRRVEIRQEDANGKLEKAWFARSATWWPDARVWSLYHGVEVTYNKHGEVAMQSNALQTFDFDGKGYNRKDFSDWSETPWVLMSGSLVPDFLGVPDLISYLRSNSGYARDKLAPCWTHLAYRFALPWQCVIVVLFAAPLAVVFSRRGLVGGIANAVGLFFVLMFLDNLFLNLGKNDQFPAFLAVWLPHAVLGAIGLYLFHLRSQNKELPKFSSMLAPVLERLRLRSN